MADTFIEYLEKYGDTPFINMPFNDVDAAILTRFCYLRFDGYVPSVQDNMPGVSISTIVLREGAVDRICEHPKKDREKLNHRQLELMASGVRFHDLRLNCFVNEIDLESQTQFSAMCMFLPGKFMFVGFRGTDDTIVGWKEDLNVLFMEHVPAHKYAVNYLNTVMDRFDSWRPYVGGHSKGGHLSVYSYMMMPKEKRDRIRHIYSMDGPAFRQKMREEMHYEEHYEELKQKLTKIMPVSSLVGMLLETDDHYIIIKSNGSGLAQHNINMWIVEDNHFVREDALKTRAVMVEKTFNGWIDSQSDEAKEIFIDNLYNAVAASNAMTVYEYADNIQNLKEFVTGIQELDEDTKNQLVEVIRSLGEVISEEVRSGVQEEGAKLREGMQEGAKRFTEVQEEGAKLIGEIGQIIRDNVRRL